ncbi:hypothetical protein LAZ67_11001096 [Cordylochernes scorpioides]|uniref:DNA helicase n=1 Tax=Cordylochernes scorpioides TaxID=51811 RepID=A0ABY6L1M4_9ARAC|nr:hypothetical protein LAZ67_11001096 [Cordylochernes scorpioides]
MFLEVTFPKCPAMLRASRAEIVGDVDLSTEKRASFLFQKIVYFMGVTWCKIFGYLYDDITALIWQVCDFNAKKNIDSLEINGKVLDCLPNRRHCFFSVNSPHVLEAQILTGTKVGHTVLVPKISLAPSNTNLHFILKRRQFPLRSAFAITINEAKGQPFARLGLLLQEPVFTHGQLHVAFSQVRTLDSIRVRLNPRIYETRNVAFNETKENKNGKKCFSQPKMNYLARDLRLSKQDAELLASRLKEMSQLEDDVNVTFYRKKKKFVSFFHYLHSHLGKFPDNLGAYSDEQGKRFHQDMKLMEERNQGVWDCHMLADYCSNLFRDLPEYTYKIKSKRLKLMKD